MLVVPVFTAVTTPEVPLTVAIDVLSLVHVPPDIDEEKVVVLPLGIVCVPLRLTTETVTGSVLDDTEEEEQEIGRAHV